MALLAALVAAPAAAQTPSDQAPTDRATQTRAAAGEEAPLVVESNEMVIRDPQKEAVYTGDVVATKGDMTLRAERLVVRYTEAGIERAHAYGEPVTMDQGARHGRASEAIYDAADRSLLLVGDAYLEEGPNTLEGARIRYYLDARRTEVFGEEGEEKGRARAVFQPGEAPGEDDGNDGDQGQGGQ
jgi:lipopolysaccharide export system protein LptA